MLLETMEDLKHKSENLTVPLDINLSDINCTNCLTCNDQFKPERIRETNNVDGSTADYFEKMYNTFCEYMNFDCVEKDDINFDFKTEIFPFCQSCKSSLVSLLKYHDDLIALQYGIKKLVSALTFKVLETWSQTNNHNNGKGDDDNAQQNDGTNVIVTPLDSDSHPTIPSDLVSRQLDLETQGTLHTEPVQICNQPIKHSDAEIRKKVATVRELIFNCFNAKVLVTKLGSKNDEEDAPKQLKTISRPRGRPRKCSRAVATTIKKENCPKLTHKNLDPEISNDENCTTTTRIPKEEHPSFMPTEFLQVGQSENEEFWENDGILSNFVEDDDDHNNDEEAAVPEEEDETWSPKKNIGLHKYKKKQTGRISSSRLAKIKSKKRKVTRKKEVALLSNSNNNVQDDVGAAGTESVDGMEEVEEMVVKKEKVKHNKLLRRNRIIFKNKNSNLSTRPKLGSNNNSNETRFQRVVEVSPNKFLYRNQFYYEKLPEESKFKCSLCGILTDHKKQMLDHLRRRRVTSCDKKKLPKSFICELCGKSFNRKDHFKEHLLTHLDVRSFLCSECGKTYKTKSRLQVHSLIHRGEEAKKYQCNLCGKKFLKNSFLKTHSLTHTGEKLSECPDCHKKFSRRCHMMRHKMSVHVEIKPYGCPLANCGKRYTQNHTLRRHMLVAHSSDGRNRPEVIIAAPAAGGAGADSAISDPKTWQQIVTIDKQAVIHAQLPSSFISVSAAATAGATTATTEMSPSETIIESSQRPGASHFFFLPQSNFKLTNH